MEPKEAQYETFENSQKRGGYLAAWKLRKYSYPPCTLVILTKRRPALPLEPGAALGNCKEMCPHPPQGAVQGSLTIVTIGLWLENRVAAQYQLSNRVFRPFAQESHEKGKSLA